MKREESILYESCATRLHIDEIECETKESLYKMLDKLKNVATERQREFYYAGHLSNEILGWMLEYGFIEEEVEPLNHYLRYRWED